MFQISLANYQFELDRQACKDVSIQEGKGFDIVQLKYDGIWGCLYKSPNNPIAVNIFSRNGLLKGTLSYPEFPEGLILAGEYMFGSQWAQHPSRLGKFFAFDVLMYNHKDFRKEPYKHRYSILQEIVPLFYNKDTIIPVSSIGTSDIEQTLKRLEKTRAYEGFVFRHWDDPYSATCGRYKLDLEEDYVVMRINPGTGKHTGRMGSLTVGQYRHNELVEIMDVGGGYSDAERDNPPPVGSVILVQGKCKFTSGALRHPNFIRTRPDKTRFECIFVEPTS